MDERLREAFAVNHAAAAQIARRALVPRHERGRPVMRRVLLALAALNACAVVAVWLSRPALVPPTPTTGAVDEVVELVGSLVDGVLIVPIPDGTIVIDGPGRRDDRPSDGYGIVLVEGEVR
jgi:hypothetical protein